MDPEEQELLGDYRYRNYSSAIEKALRNFESSSEWADLISSLGKLNKVQCHRTVFSFVCYLFIHCNSLCLKKIKNQLENTSF